MNFDKIFPDIRARGKTKLRQSQLVMLRLLKIFDYLCNKHEIEYFLIGGSMLGAVRHNGFIPWDDDLDVGMTAKNYSKFVEIAACELPYDIFFQNVYTDSYYRKTDPVDARLRDKYSSYRHKNGRNNPWHEGLQLDIFVYHRAYLPNKLSIIFENIILNKICKDPGRRFSILHKIEKMNVKGLVYGNNWLRFLGMIKPDTNSANYIKAEEIENLKKVNFEDIEVYIPSGYDTCLKRQYEDYMKLPPKNRRKPQHEVITEPFKSCQHPEALRWQDKQNKVN